MCQQHACCRQSKNGMCDHVYRRDEMKSRHALYCSLLIFSFLIFSCPSMLCGRRFVSYRPRHRNTGILWHRIWKSSVLLKIHSWFKHCILANKPEHQDLDTLRKNWHLTGPDQMSGKFSDCTNLGSKCQIGPGIIQALDSFVMLIHMLT